MLTPQGALNASLNNTLFRRRTPRRRLSRRRVRQESAAVFTARAGLEEASLGLAGPATTESLRHLSLAAPGSRQSFVLDASRNTRVPWRSQHKPYVKHVIFWAKFSTSSESPQRWPSALAALRPISSLRIGAECGPGHDARRGWRAEAAAFPPQ